MLRPLNLIGAAALAVALLPVPALANSGLDGLHSKVVLRGKVCFSDHFHHGKSVVAASKNAAVKSAIEDWAGFVAWEYGKEWADIRLAEARGKSCSENGGQWSCTLNARPCRRQ